MLQIDYKSITGNEKGRSMQVIASIKFDYYNECFSRKITVRKCPPNYRESFGKRYEGKEEYICELEDYTEDDIKNYFEIDTQIPDKDEKAMS